MKTVAIYARVSSERQVEQATIDSQLCALRERTAADGEVVLPDDVYTDEGYSGATLIRPALERLRDRIAEGGLDVLYVHSPDRLARRYAYQVVLLEEFSARGVEVRFVQAPTQNNPEDTLFLQVQGILAEYERAKILERCRRGRLHKARQGVVNALRGAPYGYLYTRKAEDSPAGYQILLPEAKVVRRIFQALVHEQKSLNEIAKTLTAERVPTRKRRPRWSTSTLRAILRNPAYAGHAAYGRTEVKPREPALRLRRGQPLAPRARNSSHRDKPKAEWISIPVPPIVSEDLFAAAQEQLERNQRLRPTGKGYLLQGLLICGCCGYAFHGASGGKPSKKRGRALYYRCYGTDTHRFSGQRVCSNLPVRADRLDEHVWKSTCEVLRDPERMLQEWTRRNDAGERHLKSHLQHDEATKVVTYLEQSLKRLLDAYENGALSLEELTPRTTRIKERLQQARCDLQAAEAQLAETITLQSITGRLEDFAKRVAQELDRLTWNQRRQVIRALVARVEIGDKYVTVVFQLPPSGQDPAGPKPASEHSQSPDRSPDSYRGRARVRAPSWSRRGDSHDK